MALKGEIIDPRDAGYDVPTVVEPNAFIINDNLLIPPKTDRSAVVIIKGQNIKEVPVKAQLDADIKAEVLLKLGNNITTDDIMPAGSKCCHSGRISRLYPSSCSKTSTRPSAAELGKQEKRGGYCCRRRELWPGIVSRTCCHSANVSRFAGSNCQIIREDSQSKLSEFWHFATALQS